MKKGDSFKLKGHVYAVECHGVPIHELVTKVTSSIIYYRAEYPDGTFGKVYGATISYLYNCLDWAAMNDDPTDSTREVIKTFEAAIKRARNDS